MKPAVYATGMKWILVVAVLLITGAFLLITRKEAPPREQRPAEGVAAEDPAAGDPVAGAEDLAAAPGPTLRAAATHVSPAKLADSTSPASPHEGAEDAENGTGPAPGHVPPEAPTITPEEEESAGLPTFKRLPGGVFVPTKPPTKEEREAAAEKTRKTLEAAKPLRTTWNDVPLQDVLRQLSHETGLVLALGPPALVRGKKIRVSDPLADADAAVAPTVWSILAALAKQHDFVLLPWKKGVLLGVRQDPEEVHLRYYDIRDFLQLKVGSGKKIAAEDRLAAVLPSLLREAAGLKQGGTIELHGGTIIARQSNAALERVGKALNTWRADPKQLLKDYTTLLSKRHPTVSGAPPRKGSKGAAAGEEGGGATGSTTK